MSVSGQEPFIVYAISNEMITDESKAGLEKADAKAGNPPIYVPTAEEQVGDFSDGFAGILKDPLNDYYPFPNGIIPQDRLADTHAWRIRTLLEIPCLEFPEGVTPLTQLHYVTEPAAGGLN